MRTVLVLLAGIVLGSLMTVSALMVTGGWYEHHILDTGDDLISMVNREGWELLPPGANQRVYQLRRPRWRLH